MGFSKRLHDREPVPIEDQRCRGGEGEDEAVAEVDVERSREDLICPYTHDSPAGSSTERLAALEIDAHAVWSVGLPARDLAHFPIMMGRLL